MKKRKLKVPKMSLSSANTTRTWFGGGGTYFKDKGGFRSVKAPFRSGGGFK
jgi:hypothetical protein